MEAEGVVGPVSVADGAITTLRLSKDGGPVVSQGHGRYYESVYRGGIYSATIAATGVAPGTALGTAPPFFLHNPASSSINLVLLSVSVGYVSGTIGAGTLALIWCAQTTAPTGGTPLVVTKNKLATSGNVVQGYTGSTTGTGLLLEPVVSLGAQLASTAVTASSVIVPIDGRWICPPGNGIGLQGIAAAGTSPVVLLGATWEEVAI